MFIPIETALEALDLSICGDVLKVEENSGIKEIVEVKKKAEPEGIAKAIDEDKDGQGSQADGRQGKEIIPL